MPRAAKLLVIVLDLFALPAALALILAVAAGWLSSWQMTDSNSELLQFVGWACDVLVHLQIVYAVAFMMVLPLLVLCRRWGVLALCVPFAGSVALDVGPYLPFGARSAAAGEGPSLTVGAFNFGGAIDRAADVVTWIERESVDLLVFSEGWPHWQGALGALHARFPYRLSYDNRAGYETWLWSRFPLEQVALPPMAPGNNVLAARLCTDTTRSRCAFIVAAHPASPVSADRVSARNRALAVMADVLNQHRDMPRIVAGDLNTTPWSAGFRGLTGGAGMIDSGLGHGLHPTWNALTIRLLFPIDHVLHSADMVTISRRVGPDLGSDHLPVVARLAFR